MQSESKRSGHKQRPQPPPLDTTTSRIPRSTNKCSVSNVHHSLGAQSPSTATPTTAMTFTTPSSAASITTPATNSATTPSTTTTAPWVRFRTATFRDDLPTLPSINTPTAASSFSQAHSVCSTPISEKSSVLEGERRSRRETTVAFPRSFPSTSTSFTTASPFILALDSSMGSVVPIMGRRSSKATSHRYASILPTPRPCVQASEPAPFCTVPASVSSASASSSTQRNVQLAVEVKRLRALTFGDSSAVSSPVDDTDITEAETVVVGNQPMDITDNNTLAHSALDHQGRALLSEKVESNGTIILMRTLQRPLLQETGPKKVERIPWLQEAVDTVNMMETRLQELEHVCQTIPLHEQDNTAMFKALQEMDNAHLEDQRWIEHTEDAVRWATFVLEEALLKSSPSSFNNERSQEVEGWCGQFENRVTDSNWRKSRSEGSLLTLTVPDVSQSDNESISTSNDVSKPTTHARVSLALRTRRQLSCAADQTRVGNESDAAEADKQGRRRRLQQNWGLVVNTRRSAELETTHKDAISAALRHLKSIEHAPTTTQSFNCNYSNSWENARTKSVLTAPSGGVTEGIDISAHRQPALADGISSTGGVSPASKSCLVTSRDCIMPSSSSISISTTAKTLNPLSVSRASIQATLSASSQSLQTDLGGCLLDERVYLKQHIQALDQLRFQEQVRYQKLEEGHRQLISDLERFSKELLGSANELTCAQASLVEACELTLLTLKTIDSPDSTNAGEMGAEGPAEGIRVDAIRQKRLAVASKMELTETKGMVEQGIKKIRRLAADCVGIAELARTQAQAQGEDVHDPTPISPATCTSPVPADASPATICSKAHLLSTIPPPSPITSFAPAASVQKPPNSMFVDGVGFQEFEGHLASLRTTFGAAPKRSMTASTTRCTSIHSPTPSSPTVANIMTTPFMKRALAEDIYPCLLINPKSTPSKPSTGWMSSLLSSSSSSSSSSLPGGSPTPPSFPMSYGSSPQTAWLHRLLNAMERNACEIELWRPAPPSRSTSLSRIPSKQPYSRGQASTATNATTSRGSKGSNIVTGGPSKAPCCLCGIVRLCEFRLRILEREDGPTALASGNKKKTHSRSSLHVDSTSVSLQHPACAAPFPSAYRRLNETFQEYHPLDRFCRDRIVAVCDFYMFLAHLRQGLLDHLSSLELFRRAVALRQRMACARIGSVDIVQSHQAQQANVNTPPPLSLALATRE